MTPADTNSPVCFERCLDADTESRGGGKGARDDNERDTDASSLRTASDHAGPEEQGSAPSDGPLGSAELSLKPAGWR